MRAYIIRRLLLTIPTVFFVTLIVFLMIRLIPGNMVNIILSQFTQATELDRQNIIHQLGFDVPVMTQYYAGLVILFLHGNLGNSLWRKSR